MAGLAKDTHSEIVTRTSAVVLIVGWILLLGGGYLAIGGLWMALGGVDEEGLAVVGWIMLAVFGVPGLSGLHLVTMGTRVKLNEPSGHITVTRGYWPILLWFLRRRVLTRSQTVGAHVVEREYETYDEGGNTAITRYHVVVVAGVTISVGRRSQAEALASRLGSWATGEPGRGSESAPDS